MGAREAAAEAEAEAAAEAVFAFPPNSIRHQTPEKLALMEALMAQRDAFEVVVSFLDAWSTARLARVNKAAARVSLDQVEHKVVCFEHGARYINSFCGFYKYMDTFTVVREHPRSRMVRLPGKKRVRMDSKGVEYVRLGAHTRLTATDVYTTKKAVDAEANNAYWRCSL